MTVDGITDRSGPQDDKRFMINRDEGREKKKIPIDLPNIDFPPSRTPPPDAPSPSPPPVKTVEIKEEKEEYAGKRAETVVKPLKAQSDHAEKAPAAASQNMTLGLILICVVFLLSITGNVYLLYQSSELKTRLDSDNKAVEGVISEKEDLRKAKEDLEIEVDRLRQEASSASEKLDRMKADNEKLIAKALDAAEKNSELQKKIVKYKADSVKFEAARKEYADAVLEERENAKKLAQVVKQQEEKIASLNNRVAANIDTMPANYEAAHSYEMGYLYAKAGMFEKAIEKFKRFIELSGENPEAYFNIAYIYHHGIKDTRNALKYYRRYIELAPGAGDLYEVKATVDSLERAGAPKTQTKFKIDLDRLKY